MKRILVVEDNETNMYLICFILRKNNCDVIEARSGEEGVKLAIKDKPLNPETFMADIEKHLR